jgi:type I restriction enzyme S subunit
LTIAHALLDLIKSGTTNVWAIYQGKLEKLLCIIPPETEQTRIVAKVDELMALCDQLEQQTETSLLAHQTLVETLLNTLLNADQNSFDPAWERIAQHFDVLFTTEHSIDQLKQTILQLAVMGKLVPQDPNDEPASVLYKKIRKDLFKSKRGKELSSFKRDKSVIEPSVFHHEIPDNWLWCELQDISYFVNGKAHEQYVTEENKYVLVNSKFVSNSGMNSIRKYVTERLTPLNKDDIALVMSDVPNGRALARSYLVECDNTYTLNQRIAGIKTSPIVNKKFFNLLLNRNPYLLAYNDGKKQSNLKKIQVLSTPIVLPPEAEQPRIVAKVDELLALCDVLKVRLQESQNTQLHLADAMAEQALNSYGNVIPKP